MRTELDGVCAKGAATRPSLLACTVVAGGFGIYISEGAGGVVIGNDVSGCRYGGLLLAEVDPSLVVEGNLIHDCHICGVHVSALCPQSFAWGEGNVIRDIAGGAMDDLRVHLRDRLD